ncbi:MAG: hypothetical protein VXZ96_14515 [Myxococcota bacterium]|nr:hypothetical protein [Myxococcota bacterium]MEC8381540.1 hypothetical protein [Myxococcota bacterium]
MIWMGLWMACGETEPKVNRDDVAMQQAAPDPSVSRQGGQGGPQGPAPKNPPPPQNGQGQRGQPGQPGPQGQGAGPSGPPPMSGPNAATAGSGGAFQDPSGFPPFHDWPAPQGPAITAMGKWGPVQQLTSKPTGGYRPQIAVGVNDVLHAVYYDRTDDGDIIRHRISSDSGGSWSSPQQLGHDSERNWGPDIVARADGSVVVVYDHALEDFSSRGYLTTFQNGSWSQPTPLTPDDGGEIGSGHVAQTVGDGLAYIYIAKKLGPEYKFQARTRWFDGQNWSEPTPLSDGTEDAWHTNVERRPDGSVLAGYDIGTGGAATTLYLVNGEGTAFESPQNVTRSGKSGERPHFAFQKNGMDTVTWFHKEKGQPIHIYVRQGKNGKWGAVVEPSKGYGGYHFDPDVAVNEDGTLCLVWGWDSGDDAEMVYSINKGDGWSTPLKVADINWGKPGLASVDVDSSGSFHVIWNQGIRGYNEVYYTKLEKP